MREWAIYELHRDGKVIYVGMTSDTAKRYGEHREKRPFLMNVVEWFQCEEKARDAEVALIAKHNPPFNKRTTRGGNLKLDDKQRAQCRKWKKEGKTVREIVGLVKSEYKIKVSHGAIQNYLTKRK
jgi:hypothetical protein